MFANNRTPERRGSTYDYRIVLYEWTERLPTEPLSGDDHALSTPMPTYSGRPLDEELALQATRAELGFVTERQSVPWGRDQRFLVREVLGRGSMGTVYLADDRKLDRKVALKGVARGPGHVERESRLEREARALAKLRHDNVLQVYDLAETDAGELLIAMEYVPGPDLRRWQVGRNLDEILDAYLQAGRGLAATHTEGITHRDFKPENVLLDETKSRPRAVVGDFGLAGHDVRTEGSRMVAGSHSPTPTKGLLGTQAYMAPEQLRREPADARSDQHQYCVALWEAIAAARPFPDDGRSLEPTASLPMRPAAMPRWIHRVLVRGLAFDREDRFSDMDRLLAVLERRRRWRRAWPWAGWAIVGCSSLAAVLWKLQPDPCEDATRAMAEIWSSDERARVDAAFRGLSKESSDDLASSIVEGLDEAEKHWSERMHEACEAQQQSSTPDPVLDRRLACLERWAERMRSRVEWLKAPDPALANRAYELVAPMLEQPDECRVPAPIIDAKVQAKVNAAEDAELLGRADAIALANEAVELAGTLGKPCQQSSSDESLDGTIHSNEMAAALYRLGHVQQRAGLSQEALENLVDAHLQALGCDDGQIFVDARLHAAKVMAVDLENFDGANAALHEADARMGALTDHALGLRRHELWKTAGLIASGQGKYDEARAHYERGLQALGDPREHPTLAAKLISNIGITYQEQNRYAKAAEAYDYAKTLVADALGPNHPETLERVARWSLTRGLLALDVGDHEAARTLLGEAARLGQPVLVVKALVARAQSEDSQGSPKLASALANELITLIDAHPSLQPRALATARSTAGQILAELGDPTGIALLSAAITGFTELGDTHSQQGTRYLLARGLHVQNRDDEARQQLDLVHQGPPLAEFLSDRVDDLEHALALAQND